MMRLGPWRWVTVLVTTLVLVGCSLTDTTVDPPHPPPSCVSRSEPRALANAAPLPLDPATFAVAQRNTQLVLRTRRPARDLYSITQHVVEHLPTPIAHVVRTTPRNEETGHEQRFWVQNADQIGYRQITARLVYVTPHVYMYLEDGAEANITALKASADLFERQSLPTDERTFGPPWSPGVDDDPHVTILNVRALGDLGGYFSSEDEYPRTVFQYSNERQMIYVNLDGGETPGDEFYNATLAHEFQHMIHWYWHPTDDSWTNEGMSILAQHINQFAAGEVDDEFLAQPDTMLGGWTDDNGSNGPRYGAGYLFNDYFAEHYGGYGVLRELLTDPAQVPLNYDNVLAAHGYKDRFNDVFAKFVIANLVNDPSVAGGIYAYPSIPGKRARVQRLVTTYPYEGDTVATPARVHQYGTEYYRFQPPATGARTLTLNFAGTPYTPIIANQPYGGASAEWWSNSGDDMDSTLTRSFDLTPLSGQQVTLNFRAWYDLEPNFDYGYVAVSTDSGQNWTTLHATTSSETNPNAANYGHGLTCTSGGGAIPTWQAETVDLSPYAGKAVQLRFETITDDAVHYQGLALDDIQIPQLRFKDDISSDNGWQAQGFIRSNNVMAEQYVLQALVVPAGGGQPVVRPVTVDQQTGRASVAITDFGGAIDHVTLAVSALAPTTLVPAQYQLSAQLT